MKNKGAMPENPAQNLGVGWMEERCLPSDIPQVHGGDFRSGEFTQSISHLVAIGMATLARVSTCARGVAPLIAVLLRQHVCPLKLAACAR